VKLWLPTSVGSLFFGFFMSIIESPVEITPAPQPSSKALRAWEQALLAAPVGRADILRQRIRKQAPVIQNRLVSTYGDSARIHSLSEQLITAAVNIALAREQSLWDLDLARQAQPQWHQQGAVGYTAYVDQFAGSLRGVIERIDYLKSLGVTYLHLLPFFKAAEGPNDGGFAVAHFEQVEPRLGNLEDLKDLTAHLRKAGISLCSDFVLNHVAQDHEWAVKARNGDARYQNFFCLAHSEAEVAEWEAHLPQIFPDTAPGNFTYQPEFKAWTWTTFYPYQWDLNYANPQVFLEVVSAMMRVANMGVEAFRLDSTGFLWKRKGTNCQNQAEVHQLLQALRALMEIACPGVLLKAEAIMPTQQLPPYFGLGETKGAECHLAYHSSLMAASWVSLAEENVSLLNSVLQQTPAVPAGSSWLTYVRCHDDIGWNVLKPDVESLGDTQHTRLLSASHFFAGLTPNSYSQGASFQTTQSKAAHGTNGMAAALVGIGSATSEEERNLAIDRLLLLQGLSFFMGGLPLLYMGDEWGLSNTSEAELTVRKGPDGRELHRPYWDDKLAALRLVTGTTQHHLFHKIQQLVQLRKQLPEFHGDVCVAWIDTKHTTVLTLKRGQNVWGVFNFSSHATSLKIADGSVLNLKPYGFAWVRAVSGAEVLTLVSN
jgi:amylosucrase